MNLRERKKKGRSNRPRRSVVENNLRNKIERRKRREKDTELIAALGSSFEQYVTEYVMFLAHVQLELDENQNPNLQRMRDELIAKLGSNCRRHKRDVEIRSIYFRPENQADRATDALVFNYKKRDKFIDVAAFKQFTDQYAQHPYGSLVGVCESEVNPSIVHIEDFQLKFDSYTTLKRREAFIRKRVYVQRVNDFTKVKYKKNQKGDEFCSVCIIDYKIGEEIVKVPCGHLFHKKCLKNCMLISYSCPICRKVLA